jgi:hypothetical protein
MRSLLRELSPDIDECEDGGPSAIHHADPQRPWLEEFQEYMDSRETVPENMTTIQWWGVSACRFCLNFI